MNSAFYVGSVRHRRFLPRSHVFRYRMFMLMLDLDELEQIDAELRGFSTSGRSPVQFRRSDHVGDSSASLKDVILDEVETHLGHRPAGPVRLLTQPRIWGIGFNPLSVYYCYGPDGESVEALVAEVTNTPWGERHLYVLPGCADGQTLNARFQKSMHVSPFMGTDQEYRLRGRSPGRRLALHLESNEDGNLMLDATLTLRRRPLTTGTLIACLLTHPASTAKVIAAIHWQAVRLFLKRLKIHPHTGPSRAPETRITSSLGHSTSMEIHGS